jgi:hypothetical protein
MRRMNRSVSAAGPSDDRVPMNPWHDVTSDEYRLMALLVGQLPTDKRWTSAARQRWLHAVTSLVDVLIAQENLPLPTGEEVPDTSGVTTIQATDVLSAEEAETQYGFSRHTILSWVKRGQLRAVDLEQGHTGRPHQRFAREDVERLVAQSRGPHLVISPEEDVTDADEMTNSPSSVKTRQQIRRRRRHRDEGGCYTCGKTCAPYAKCEEHRQEDRDRRRPSLVTPTQPEHDPIARDADAPLPAHLMAEMRRRDVYEDDPAFAPSVPGERVCLKCDQRFMSPDRVRIRLCNVCRPKVGAAEPNNALGL